MGRRLCDARSEQVKSTHIIIPQSVKTSFIIGGLEDGFVCICVCACPLAGRFATSKLNLRDIPQSPDAGVYGDIGQRPWYRNCVSFSNRHGGTSVCFQNPFMPPSKRMALLPTSTVLSVPNPSNSLDLPISQSGVLAVKSPQPESCGYRNEFLEWRYCVYNSTFFVQYSNSPAFLLRLPDPSGRTFLTGAQS